MQSVNKLMPYFSSRMAHEIFFFCYRDKLSLSMIENVHKKRAHDKESRLSTVMVCFYFVLSDLHFCWL